MLMAMFNDNNLEAEQPDVNPPIVTVDQRVAVELATFDVEPSVPLMHSVDDVPVFTNPLDWWKTRKHKYPILSRVATALLCITATSAPSERLFSSAGLTIANRRARMHGDNAAALIFLHAALPTVKKLEAERLLGIG